MKHLYFLLFTVALVTMAPTGIFAQCPTGNIIYVDSAMASDGNGEGWNTAYKSLGDALQAADTCNNINEIWIKNGTYTTGGYVISKNGLKLYGGFAGTETSVSQRDTLHPSRITGGTIIKPVRNGIIDTSTLLDGFTVTGQSITYGGGMQILCDTCISCNPIINNCRFSQNYATIGGAAIYIAAVSGICGPQITNCLFTNNSCGTVAQGETGITEGVIQNGGGGNGTDEPVIANCTFQNNKSISIYNLMVHGVCNVTIDSCNFTGNPGVFSDADSSTINVAINNCNFIGDTPAIVNNCVAIGGGSLVGTSNITINNCYFNLDVGVIYNDGSFGATTVFLNNSTITGNHIFDGTTIDIEYCIQNSVTYGNGQSKLTVNGCNFTDNWAFNGGAILSSDSLIVNNCNFTGNNAYEDGGAIYISAGIYNNINNCNFNYNLATYLADEDQGDGGAIYANAAPSSLYITHCNFTGNADKYSGAVHTFMGGSGSSTVRIDDCSFIQNTPSAIVGEWAINSSWVVSNSIFSGNGEGIITSPYDLYANNTGETWILNSTFYDNTNAAVYGYYDGANDFTTHLRNCILQGSGNPQQLYGTGGDIKISLENCLTQYIPSSSPYIINANSIVADPIFTDATTGNFTLQPGSPGINFGDTTGVSQWIDSTDLAGNPRIQGCRIDAGAYEASVPSPNALFNYANDTFSTIAAGTNEWINCGTGLVVDTGVQFVATQIGDYELLNTLYGCSDTSICTPVTTLCHSISIQAHIIMCNGDSVFFNGQILHTAGTYNDTVLLNNECDSISSLVLQIAQQANDTISVTTCSNLPYLFKGMELNVSGMYADTLQSVYGCDSFIYIQLNVLPVSSDTIYFNICQGQSYSFKNSQLTSTGIYPDTMQNVNGCDSIIFLNLNVADTSATSLNQILCAGDTFYIGHNQYYKPGYYVVTMENMNGCDSIVSVTLSPNPVDTIYLSGDTLYALPYANAYEWMDCINDTLLPGAMQYYFVPSQSGIYAAIVTRNSCIDTTNCISTITTQTVNFTGNMNPFIYPDPATDKLFINAGRINPQVICIYNLNGQKITERASAAQIDIGALPPGIYFVEIKGAEANAVMRFVKM